MKDVILAYEGNFSSAETPDFVADKMSKYLLGV